MIEFTPEEQTLIADLSTSNGWDDPTATPLKNKIKPFFLLKTSNCCCYCRRSMHQWHQMTIDIEHVLPKAVGAYPQYMFEPINLSVACKRCNMGIKRSDTSFYLATPDETNPFRSELYMFIHPNLDDADDHLDILFCQHNGNIMVKYVMHNGSAKGRATYEYFALGDIEVNSFDEAQGLEGEAATAALPPEFAQALTAVLRSQ